MIKLIVFLSVVAISPMSFASNNSSSEKFEFAREVIEINYKIQSCIELFASQDNYKESNLSEGDALQIVSRMITGMKRCSIKMEQMQDILTQYFNNKDETIEAVSKGVYAGIYKYNLALNNLIELYGGNFKGELELMKSQAIYEAEFAEALDIIRESSSAVIYGLVEIKDDVKTSDKISFLITQDQRKLLIGDIDRFFGEELKDFKKWREDKSPQKQDFNNGRIILGIESIKENLQMEKYE